MLFFIIILVFLLGVGVFQNDAGTPSISSIPWEATLCPGEIPRDIEVMDAIGEYEITPAPVRVISSAGQPTIRESLSHIQPTVVPKPIQHQPVSVPEPVVTIRVPEPLVHMPVTIPAPLRSFCVPPPLPGATPIAEIVLPPLPEEPLPNVRRVRGIGGSSMPSKMKRDS